MSIKQGRVENVDVENVSLNSWNPNFMAEDTFRELKDNIDELGYVQPVLVRPVDDGFEVVDGEHRFKALKRLGVESFDCVVRELSDEEAKVTTLNMNDIKGEDNPIKLAEVLSSIESRAEKDLSELTSMDEDEIESYKILNDIPDSDEVEEEGDDDSEESGEDPDLNEEDTGEEPEEGKDEFNIVRIGLDRSDAEDLMQVFDCEIYEIDERLEERLGEEFCS